MSIFQEKEYSEENIHTLIDVLHQKFVHQKSLSKEKFFILVMLSVKQGLLRFSNDNNVYTLNISNKGELFIANPPKGKSSQSLSYARLSSVSRSTRSHPPTADSESEKDTLIKSLIEEISGLKNKLASYEASVAELENVLFELREKSAFSDSPTPESLSPRQVPEIWRNIAKQAIHQRWSIRQSKTSQLEWIPPDGRIPVVTTSAPTGTRSLKSAKEKLEAAGLILKNP